MKRTTLVIFLLALGLALALAGCQSGPATVNVTLTEWQIALDVDSVPAGEVIFNISNSGNLEHNFYIQDVTGVDRIFIQTQESLTVTLEPGTYNLYCDLEGHQEAGMETTFTVK